MRAGGLHPLVMAVLVTAALPAAARAQSEEEPTSSMDGAWHFVFAPYIWCTGIEGVVGVAELPEIPVDASFSDILENFDLGLEGHFEARKDRMGLGLDFIWSNLGVPVAGEAGAAEVTVDIRQTTLEGFAFYRLASGGRADNPGHLDVLAGARLSGTRTRLNVAAGPGEASSEPQEISWVDAMAGLKFRVPIGGRFALLGRGDIAGLGSQLTWNLEGDLAFQPSRHWVLGAGWRHLDIDYDEGEGVERKHFDIAYDGPRTWAAYRW